MLPSEAALRATDSFYTPPHITESAPSVLNFSLPSLLQTVPSSVSVQFVKPLEVMFSRLSASVQYLALREGRVLLRSDTHSAVFHVFSRLLYLSSSSMLSSVRLRLNPRRESAAREALCSFPFFLVLLNVLFLFFFFNEKQGQATMGSSRLAG